MHDLRVYRHGARPELRETLQKRIDRLRMVGRGVDKRHACASQQLPNFRQGTLKGHHHVPTRMPRSPKLNLALQRLPWIQQENIGRGQIMLNAHEWLFSSPDNAESDPFPDKHNPQFPPMQYTCRTKQNAKVATQCPTAKRFTNILPRRGADKSRRYGRKARPARGCKARHFLAASRTS